MMSHFALSSLYMSDYMSYWISQFVISRLVVANCDHHFIPEDDTYLSTENPVRL